MRGSSVLFSSAKNKGRDDWGTPKSLYGFLNNEHGFTLDPCSNFENHKCDKFFTEKENGLLLSWENEIVFCNPPYSQNKVWTKKCFEEGQKTKVVLLTTARTDTFWFHEYCLKANEIFLIRGRLTFEIDGQPVLDKKGKPMSAPFPSMIVVFDQKNKKKDIKISGLDLKKIF